MENYKFFRNDKCEYFPCHEVSDPENFNCLFCYCPLYALGSGCGGNFVYIEEYGIKDCSNCLIPHSGKAYEYILSRMYDVIKIAGENR